MGDVNIKDVAKKAKVSISTVSRVVNATKPVSTELQVKVENAIRELGYSTNSIARGLKVSQTKEVAVMITDLNRNFFGKVIEGINREAIKYGYKIFIVETKDSLEKEQELVETFVSKWIDGIIIASSAYGDDLATKKYIERLGNLSKRGNSIPVVTLEYDLGNPKIHAIVVNHEKAAFKAVNHLITEAGRKELLYVSLPSGHVMGEQRMNGYKRALKANGIKFNSENVLQGEYTTYSGYEAVMERAKVNKKFDGIFCANDQMAVGAIKACEELNLRVPEDVAVIGNDDIFVTSLIKPSLSTIHVPRRRMGVHAMKRLVELIENDKIPKKRIITLDTELIARESTVKDSTNRMDWTETDW